jgi:hypothetical protein
MVRRDYLARGAFFGIGASLVFLVLTSTLPPSIVIMGLVAPVLGIAVGAAIVVGSRGEKGGPLQLASISIFTFVICAAIGLLQWRIGETYGAQNLFNVLVGVHGEGLLAVPGILGGAVLSFIIPRKSRARLKQ